MILCSGCFDGLHAGHVAYLEAARRDGHLTVVAVAPDEYIRRVKGRDPRYTLADRLRVIRALACVDAALPHGADGAANTIRSQRPYEFVKGADWAGRLPADILAAAKAVGCRITIVASDVTLHTSDALSAHQ